MDQKMDIGKKLEIINRINTENGIKNKKAYEALLLLEKNLKEINITQIFIETCNELNKITYFSLKFINETKKIILCFNWRDGYNNYHSDEYFLNEIIGNRKFIKETCLLIEEFLNLIEKKLIYESNIYEVVV
jgi:hypothetical protein